MTDASPYPIIEHLHAAGVIGASGESDITASDRDVRGMATVVVPPGVMHTVLQPALAPAALNIV